MADENKSPARLFFFLARTAPVGVILRRGPSKWVQMIQWHTKADVFRPGQWFHGRIFEELCDLSPNGKWFAYHAFKPNNRLKNPSYGNRWTAVSKPPRFTAAALWTHLNGYGGGYFLKNNLMFLNHMDDNKTVHPAHPIPKDLEIKTIETYEDESRYMFNSVHLNAMLRDGWEVAPGFPSRSFYLFIRRDDDPLTKTARVKLEKRRRNMTLICSVFDIGRRKREKEISHRYRFALKIGETEQRLDGVTWADFDYSKRLVLAKEGKLFSATFDKDELVWTELQDFNYERPSK